MKKIVITVLLLVMFVLSACGPKVTPTEVPTQTALPTYTAMPTYTPFPTPTPIPTAVIPQSYVVNGVELTFTGVQLFKNSFQMGDQLLTPDPGYAVLVVYGEYSGNLDNLFGDGGAFQPIGVLYVSEKDGTVDEWVYEYHTWGNIETEGNFQIAFFSKIGFTPYTLVNTIETQFKIDLATLMGNL